MDYVTDELLESISDLRSDSAPVKPSRFTSLLANAMLSVVLDNVLHDFEDLRDRLERAGQKEIDDVRSFGDTSAGALLRGFGPSIEYADLVNLIGEMRVGIARRRVAAES